MTEAPAAGAEGVSWGGARASPAAPISPSLRRSWSLTGAGCTSYAVDPFKGCPSRRLQPSSPSGSTLRGPSAPQCAGRPAGHSWCRWLSTDAGTSPAPGESGEPRPPPHPAACWLAQVGGAPCQGPRPVRRPHACLPGARLTHKLGEHRVFLIRGMTLGYEWS